MNFLQFAVTVKVALPLAFAAKFLLYGISVELADASNLSPNKVRMEAETSEGRWYSPRRGSRSVNFFADLDTNLQLKSKILFMLGVSTHSHRTAIEPLAHALVDRGHEVTFLTPIKPTKPNPKFHEVSTVAADWFYANVMSHIGDAYFPPRLLDKYANAFAAYAMSSFNFVGANLFFNGPELKPWFMSSKYDLVILDNSINKFGYAIAYKFGARVILSSSAGFYSYNEEVFGVPSESSWLPNYFIQNIFTDYLTFYDRVMSAVYGLYYKWYTELFTIPELDRISREALQIPDMPSIADLEMETSLLFTNQFYSQDYARSLPPVIVQIGGIHCHCEDCSVELDTDLEEFISEAGDAGFIFISFGSIVSMSKVPDYFLNQFFDAIKNMKTRFLWKWEKTPPANLPNNVYSTDWFPQQDLLAHPKIKGFITHGGLMSVQQSICHKVPMIVIPIFADQPYNARTVVKHGLGIHLELSELTTETLIYSINQLLTNPIYSTNIERASELFKDRPLSGIDTAVYWTEYVLRHKNTTHLKPQSMHQYWFEKRLLDVWFFILIVTTFTIHRVFVLFAFFKNSPYSPFNLLISLIQRIFIKLKELIKYCRTFIIEKILFLIEKLKALCRFCFKLTSSLITRLLRKLTGNGRGRRRRANARH